MSSESPSSTERSWHIYGEHEW